MATVHFILQGKGGVGKSFIASGLAQWKKIMGSPALCIDTDPVNATFHGYEDLNVRRLEIMQGEEIDPRSFDALVEIIANTDRSDVIVDNGASSFLPLATYLISNEVPALLKEMGHKLVIHSVITGGQALMDTLNGFASLASQIEGVPFVVWLNQYWGPIEAEGKSFEEMKGYTSNKKRVAAIIEIPHRKAETFGRDLGDMLKARQTFDQAQQDPSLTIMTRQRLKMYSRDFFAALDAVKAVL